MKLTNRQGAPAWLHEGGGLLWRGRCLWWPTGQGRERRKPRAAQEMGRYQNIEFVESETNSEKSIKDSTVYILIC
jgi:hypothetical protein